MGTIIRLICKATLAAVILTASVVALPALASTLTQANDYTTSNVVGTQANHQVIFTTPSGVGEGQTISLTFSSLFTMGVLSEDDVDIADDGVDLTTAADCSGAEKASVGVMGSTFTITICAGDGGAIAGGSQVTIEIGTNATFSGVGALRITNPATRGTYYLSIAGTFGDSGSIAYPIDLDGPVGVTATVPVTGGGGGGGGGGAPVPGDVTAPIISNVLVSNLTTTGATLTWNTNEPANSAVDYGLTPAFEIATVSGAIFVMGHSVTLNGLCEGCRYFFRVRSTDFDNNTSTSGTFTFTTLDQTAPEIFGIVVSNLTTTSAKISWTTNEPASSVIEYGTTVAYGLTSTDNGLVLNHERVLVGLATGTLYHFRVKSTDASTNLGTSGDQTFTTVVDAPPANVGGLLIAEGNAQLTLSWVNPPDVDLASIRVIMCPNALPDSIVDPDCATVFNGLANSFIHNGLTNGTTYYYGVFARDLAGQFSSGALGSGAPKAPEDERPADVPVVPVQRQQQPVERPQEPEIPGEPREAQPGVREDEIAPVSPLGAVETGKLDLSDVSLFVARSILLTRSTFGTFDVLAGEPLRIWVPASEFKADREFVTVQIGDQAYLMRLNKDATGYETDILTPSEVSSYPFEITAVYKDLSEERVSSILRVVDRGFVFGNIDGEEVRVNGAQVKLFQQVLGDLVAWDGSPYGQNNPQTAEDGSYAFYVPNDLYVLRITARGFREYESKVIAATSNIVNANVPLTVYPREEEQPAKEPKVKPEHQATLLRSFDVPALEAVAMALESIRENPAVQTTADIALPTLVVTAGASVAVLSVAFNFIPFLHYLFTAPLIFFGRKKRKDFGVVYNANTKTPVDLAVVRLYRHDANKPNGLGQLVKSRVTDKAGRFFFPAEPGQYKIVVTKRAFVYPATSLMDLKEDGDYLDLYHGEPIAVNEVNTIITPNIPMAPQDPSKELTPMRVVWKRRMRVIQNVVALTGVTTSIAVAIVRPSMLAVSMIGVQVVVYALAQRLAKPMKPKRWGIVYDSTTNRPLSQVVARIFEPKYNKLLDMQVSDSKGQYAFLLGTGDYYAVFQKPGYFEVEVRPINVDAKKGAGGFSADIKLAKP